VAVSPLGNHVYLAAYRDDDLVVFSPEPGAASLGVAALGTIAALRARLRRA
jgi:hypothetical protein